MRNNQPSMSGRVSFVLLLGGLLALLVSCRGGVTSPVPTSFLPPQVLTPTYTPIWSDSIPRPSPSPTDDPVQQPTLSPTLPAAATVPSLIPSPTIEPTKVPVPQPVGPFEPFLSVEGQPEGSVRDLRVAPDGTLWLVTSEGVGSLHEGTWTIHPGLGRVLLGFDEQGRTWLVPEDGETISVWDGVAWSTFGAGQGWIPTGSIWQVPGYRTVSEDPVTDGRGWIWLSTSRDVRVFNGQRWTVYLPEEVGYERTADMDDMGLEFALTDMAVDGAGNVWVGDCAWMGPGPLGQGARWFDGSIWQGQDSPEVGSGCVEDIEVDPDGRIWIGVGGELLRHLPGEGWTTILHPATDNTSGDRRWGWLSSVELGGPGTAWVNMSPCGGASCESGVYMLFLVTDEGWIFVNEEGPEDLAVDADGNGWMCLGDALYRISFDQMELVYQQDLFGCSVEIDPEGRAWLSVQGWSALWTTN